MNASKSISDTNPLFRLGIAAAVVFWLFLLYGRSLYQATPLSMRWLWVITAPLNLTMDFLNPLFWSPLLFLIGYLCGVGTLLWALLSRSSGKPWRIVVAVGCVIALGFPLMLPRLYGTYQLPVKSTAGYDLQWVTQPNNRYDNAYKQAQKLHEGGCAYRLVGWSANHTLHYRSSCWPGVGQYNAVTKETNWSFGNGKHQQKIDSSSIEKRNGNVFPASPSSLQSSGEYPFQTTGRALSPDGTWEAVVVRWFYGPSDIVLLRQSNS